MNCPRCNLFNPDSELRCDCGCDFEFKTVERAYFRQEIPRASSRSSRAITSWLRRPSVVSIHLSTFRHVSQEEELTAQRALARTLIECGSSPLSTIHLANDEGLCPWHGRITHLNTKHRASRYINEGQLLDRKTDTSPGVPGERNQGIERPIFDPEAVRDRAEHHLGRLRSTEVNKRARFEHIASYSAVHGA
jgi:hypothetical protein